MAKKTGEPVFRIYLRKNHLDCHQGMALGGTSLRRATARRAHKKNAKMVRDKSTAQTQ